MATDDRRPLTETIFYVLLALGAPLHGYGIMQQVNELTAGRVALGAGTLYGALTNLTEKGWIRPLPGGGRRSQEGVRDHRRRAQHRDRGARAPRGAAAQRAPGHAGGMEMSGKIVHRLYMGL